MLARCPLHDEQFEFLQQHIKSLFFKMGPNMKILIFSKTCAVGSFYEKESGDLGWLGLVGQFLNFLTCKRDKQDVVSTHNI